MRGDVPLHLLQEVFKKFCKNTRRERFSGRNSFFAAFLPTGRQALPELLRKALQAGVRSVRQAKKEFLPEKQVF
jgi:hypothetical protein